MSAFQQEINEDPPQPVEERTPFWRRLRLAPAFWTTASVISLTVNIILLLVVYVLAAQLFRLKDLVQNDLLAGLVYNFALMDQAKITTMVTVDTTIPVQFNLPISQQTTVILTQDTFLDDARVDLYTGGLTISNAPTDIMLRAGTPMDIKLEMTVPVDATIPVTLQVPVDIPLNQTELHEPFVGLQNVVRPYYDLLHGMPDSWEEALMP